MFDNTYFSVLVVFGIFAIGDYLGVISKAKLSSVFVALMIFLIGFMTGIIPADIVTRAKLTDISKIATGFLVFNMGTSVNIQQIKKEWRVVIMSLVAMLIAVVAVIAVIPLIGREAALVSIPIVNGGIVATQIMTEAALAKSMTLAAALGTIVFAVQKFVGTIPASRAGLSEARILLDGYRQLDKSELKESHEKEVKKDSSNTVAKKHAKYFTNYMTLGIAAFFIYLADLIGGFTGISMSIWCLVVGIIVGTMGLVPSKILDHGKSAGLWMTLTFTSLIPSLAKIKLSDLGALGFQTVVVFGAVLVFIYLFLFILPGWKLIGSKNLAIGIAMSQLLGFPATYLIVNEVATAVAETDDERQYIINKLTPAFVISGFVSVTTVSILVAGVFAKFL